jgi:hypothetical protein
MTASRTSTIETLGSPPPGPPERRLLTAAGSPSLYSGVAPTRLAFGYLQFCGNSPRHGSATAPTASKNGAGLSNPDSTERS